MTKLNIIISSEIFEVQRKSENIYYVCNIEFTFRGGHKILFFADSNQHWYVPTTHISLEQLNEDFVYTDKKPSDEILNKFYNLNVLEGDIRDPSLFRSWIEGIQRKH